MSRTLAWHRSHRWLYAGLLALGASLPSTSARAADAANVDVETVHLQYSAERTCPSEAAFVSALRRDTDAFQLVGADEARRLVDVELRVASGGAYGRFEFVDRGHGTTIRRELKGPDCEAVARALALMLALAMHRLSSEPASSGSGGPTNDAGGAASDVRDHSTAEPAQSQEPALAPPTVPTPPLASTPTSSTSPPAVARSPNASRANANASPKLPARRLSLSLDLQGAFTSAVAKDALPFAVMTLQLQPEGWKFRPSIGISFRQSLPHEIAVAGGHATFLWSAGAVRLCPHVVVIGTFDIAPCAEVALGLLRADANGLPGARSSSNLWEEATLLVAGRWHFTPRWFLTTTATGTVALSRTRFGLSSGTLISQTPPLGFGAGLGLGLSM